MEKLSQGHDALDKNHIKEGVVVHVEAPGHETNYKYKSWHFCSLEDIKKNTEDFIDMEDIA